MKRFQEQTTAAHSGVDRAQGIVRGAKLLGMKSRNGRKYSENAVQKAVSLYEGAPVNFDHDVKRATSRGIAEAIGYVKGVRYQPGEGLFGDIHYLKSHPMGEAFAEAAERFHSHFGLSHMIDADTDRTNKIVESIRKVHSVDVVRSPATTHGLFESETEVYAMRLQEIVEALEDDDVCKDFLSEACEDDSIAGLEVILAEEATTKETIEAAITAVFESRKPAKLDNVELLSEDLIEMVADKIVEKIGGTKDRPFREKLYVESVDAGEKSSFDPSEFRKELKSNRR